MKILFPCTGNSCRSQMAEAWARLLKGDRYDTYSAGVQPKPIDPRAFKAMAEAGIDISEQKSKDVDVFANMEFDYVITLCDNARESCPYFPAKTKLIHQSNPKTSSKPRHFWREGERCPTRGMKFMRQSPVLLLPCQERP